MSRIGKKLIKILDGVEVKIDNQKIRVKGPKGELEKTLPDILDIKIDSGTIGVGLKSGAGLTKDGSRLWGLGRALIATMVKGVSGGFERILEFSGIGYKAQVKGDTLELNLGYNNPVLIKALSGVSFQVEKNVIKVTGADKEKVGQVAASIRAARPPEPYKGSGIKYREEIIIKKAGKKAVAAG